MRRTSERRGGERGVPAKNTGNRSRPRRSGKERRLRRLREEMREAFREALIEDATRRLGTRMTEAAERVAAKEIDPYTLVEGLVEEFRG